MKNNGARVQGPGTRGFRGVLGGVCALILVALGPAFAQSAWKNASPDHVFEFPRDHASHPDSKIEWWYYTGNVATASGRRFGYQVTFFRVGVDHTPVNPSKWAVRDIFMAHLAVSDPDGKRYRFDERLSRGGPGLSGAATDRYRVWNDDWSSGLDASGRHVIQARSREAAVEFTLEEGKAPALNGVKGFSQKGAQPGNASNYYSLTRMPTRGTITIDGERFDVIGESWMDHEFGTSFLEPEQQGWDWLSIQLDDRRELMLYQLRRADGSRDPRSSGTLIEADGRTRHLTAADFTLAPTGTLFTSPSGATYPIGWTIGLPSEGLTLTVSTPLANQELRTLGAGVAYWEGMIQVAGTARGRAVSGRGYLEMTGYKGSLGRVMSLTAK